MKKLLVAIMTSIIAVGAISAAMLLGFDDNFSITSLNPVKSTAAMLGHVTLIATDQNGNIIGYRQTDNVIVNHGDDCLSDLIFAQSSGVTCTLVAASMFDNISIGFGAQTTTAETTSLANYLTDGGLVSPTGFDSAVITPAANSNAPASTLITAVFRSVGAQVTEAAIQAGSLTAGLESILAYQTFSTLPLGASDDLTVQWTVTIAGS